MVDYNIKSIVWALRKIVSLIYHDSRNMVKKYGITGPQSLVIKSLYSSEHPLSSATLSRNLNVTPSNITGIIDRLEEKELVKRTRHQLDRRTTLIELTEKGTEYGKILPDLIEEKLARELKNLKQKKISDIQSALNYIIQTIGSDDGIKDPESQEYVINTELINGIKRK
ncbi:MAG: MarR family winged helix-turn-helix transcriptional regulator [Candidatus Aminicenantaceae bacterium]